MISTQKNYPILDWKLTKYIIITKVNLSLLSQNIEMLRWPSRKLMTDLPPTLYLYMHRQVRTEGSISAISKTNQIRGTNIACSMLKHLGSAYVSVIWLNHSSVEHGHRIKGKSWMLTHNCTVCLLVLTSNKEKNYHVKIAMDLWVHLELPHLINKKSGIQTGLADCQGSQWWAVWA